MIKYIDLIKRLIIPNLDILPCSRLYTIISIFPDATRQQILVSKPAIWELASTGRSLRQSQIIIIIIIIIIILVVGICKEFTVTN
jgi:hypothetical protein